MATKSFIYGSDETSFQDCDVCKFQNVTSESVSYCTICREYLCTTCDKAHRGSKLTRNHKLLAGSNLPSASTTTKLTSPIMFCDDHKTMIVDMYCKSHDVVICSACKITSHMVCKLTDVSQEIKQMKIDGSFNRTKTRLEDLKTQHDNMKAMINRDKRIFKSQLQKCLENMSQIRNEINETLDSIEKTLSKEIKLADERMTNGIEGHIAIFDDFLSEIIEHLKNLKESEKAQDDHIMFIEMKKASIAQHKYVDTMAKMQQYLNQPELLKINDTLYDTVKQLQSIETVLVDRHGIRVNMSIPGRRDINIGCPSVCGCTFMPDGHLVLCCGYDGLKLLDTDFKIKSQLHEYAQCVAAIDDNEIIVTHGNNNKQIQIVTIFRQMKVSKTMNLNTNCYGVDVFGDAIYVACREPYGNAGNGEIKVLNMDGTVQRTLGLNNGIYMFKQPDFVTISYDGSKVFVSDLGTHTVTCLDTQGDVIYQYSDPNLKGPHGMYVHCKDNLLVCGFQSYNIHIIGRDGRTEEILLSKADGGIRPCCIAFRPSDGCLVLGIYNDSNKSLVSCTSKYMSKRFLRYP